MTVTLGFATSNFDESPTFKIKCTAGVIQSATMLTPGCVPVALTGLHAATGATGSGAVFNFTRQDAVKDWSACNQTGYAAAAARRQWHGMLGLTSHDAGAFKDVVCSDPTKNYESYQQFPSQNKYCAYTFTSFNFTYAHRDTFGEVSWYGDITGALNVNPLSGIRTNTIVTTEQNRENNTDPLTNHFQTNPTAGAYTYQISQGGYTTPGYGPATDFDQLTLEGNVTQGNTFTGNLNLSPDELPFSLESYIGVFNTFCSDWSLATARAGYSSKTLPLVTTSTFDAYASTAGAQSADGTSFATITLSWTRTETSFVWNLDYENQQPNGLPNVLAPLYQSVKFSGRIDLSALNSAANLETDANSLLAPWNVNDRKLMPLTTGVWAGNCVKVTRNEVQTNVSPLGGSFVFTGYVDPNSYIFDGSIRGAPNTAVDGAGNPVTPDDYFDPYYQDVPKDGGTPSGYGGWRGSGLPPRATQWTNTCEAWGLPIGRMRKYNLPLNLTGGSNDDALWVTKWVESCILLPSVDHARPYGADRTLVDWVAWRAQNGGLPCAEGFTPVVTYRFPSCPPFAGRLAITSVTDNHNGTVTIVADAPPKPIDETVPSGQSFTVDLCGATMTALASNLTVTTLTPATTFKVTAAYATVAAAKWVVLYGALAGEPTVNWTTPDSATHPIPHWYWQDTERKMQMAQLEWIYDLRTSLEASRFYNTDGSVLLDGCNGSPVPGVPYYDSGSQLHNADTTDNYGYYSATLQDVCKSFNPCCPWLIVLSGCVSDTPPTGTGVRYDFSTTIQLDERYGSKSQLDVSQAMVDPLFEQPLQCNDITFQIENQPGTCIPYRESRLILPGASSMTTPPDNGAGTGQNETPAMLVDYTEISPATNKTGNLANPPFSLDGATQPPDDPQASQPPCVFIPSGNFTTC
jgi:hypothetical protein